MNKPARLAVSVFIVVSFLISIYLYPHMPEYMPTSWNAQGEVSGHMHKFYALFLLPIITTACVLLFYFIPKIDPLKKNIAKFRSHYDGFIIIFTAYMFYMYILTVVANFEKNLNMTKLMIPAFSVLIYYTGNFLKEAKRNWFVGIRTPWTLSHDKVWEKTHNLGGILFKISGAISLLGLVLEEYAIFLIMVPLLSSSLFLIVYSYLVYTKVSKKH